MSEPRAPVFSPTPELSEDDEEALPSTKTQQTLELRLRTSNASRGGSVTASKRGRTPQRADGEKQGFFVSEIDGDLSRPRKTPRTQALGKIYPNYATIRSNALAKYKDVRNRIWDDSIAKAEQRIEAVDMEKAQLIEEMKGWMEAREKWNVEMERKINGEVQLESESEEPRSSLEDGEEASVNGVASDQEMEVDMDEVSGLDEDDGESAGSIEEV